MKTPIRRRALRGGAVLATAVLTVGLAGTPSATAAVVPTPSGSDPSPAAVGAAYLAAQPGTNGIIVSHSEYNGTQYDTPSPGITIDAAVSLDAVGGQAAEVATMAAGVEASTYPAGSAGSAAKFAAFEYTLGRTSSALAPAVNAVRDAISTTARTGGRLEDARNDYESPLTQAYAVKALHDAGSAYTASATSALTFLLAQQCSAGYVRDAFSDKSDSNQSCDPTDPSGSAPSVDYTAFTVLELQDQKSAATVATSLAEATSWLLTQQAANGSFGDGNANTTGLAGWALGVSGQTAAAAKAATWLRDHQLANAGACAPYAGAINGGIVADDLGLANAKAGPLDQNDQSTVTYATAQALPALLWAPGGTQSGDTTLTGPKSFVKAGSTQGLAVSGAPGNTLCVTQGATHTRLVIPASGSLTVPVTLPAATGDTVVNVVDAGGETDTATYSALGEKTLRLRTAKKLERGERAKVRVKGLAAKEKVRVYLGPRLVEKGRANGHGVFRGHFVVKHRLGRVTLRVKGQFGGLRNDAEKIRVVR